MKIKNMGAFTLVEILVGVLIVSFVMVAGFQSLTSASIGKVRLIQQTEIQKQSFYFSEKLFEMIKKGGALDYEEYFNRKIVGDTSFQSGHFLTPTGFGNFGEGGSVGSTNYGANFYYCRSGNGVNMMGTGGCVATSNTGSLSSDTSYSGSLQRYGQYSFQFIDYNSNRDADLGDENNINGIIGDDDDEYLGEGPNVFSSGENIHELYLINGMKKERILFRWKVQDDPEYTASACNYGDGSAPTGDGCLGTIEYLKLSGKDWGMNHDEGTIDTNKTQYDGVVDTWIIDNDFTTVSDTVGGSDMNNYWVALFPDTIHVSNFKIFAYPNKDRELAWKDTSASTNLSPYVKIQVSLLPSWKSRKQIKGNPKELKFSTTISLTDIFSN